MKLFILCCYLYLVIRSTKCTLKFLLQVYSLGVIIYRVANFNNCEEAAEELKSVSFIETFKYEISNMYMAIRKKFLGCHPTC